MRLVTSREGIEIDCISPSYLPRTEFSSTYRGVGQQLESDVIIK